MAKFKDITGQKFNRLTVIERDYSRPKGKRYWLCRCQCTSGKIVSLSTGNIVSGNTKSCGCLRKKAENIARHVTHGMSKSHEYGSWYSMKRRCNNPKNKDFRHYGGRGISYDPSWGKFENFIADMGPAPSAKHTLERLDNNLGYYNDNVIWADTVTQGRHTARNHLVTYRGVTKCISAWAEEFKLSYNTLIGRLKHWKDIEKALLWPVRHTKRIYKASRNDYGSEPSFV